MQISATVTLAAGDTLPADADAAAAAVLSALGGDPANDSASVYIQVQDTGLAGTALAAREAPEV